MQFVVTGSLLRGCGKVLLGPKLLRYAPKQPQTEQRTMQRIFMMITFYYFCALTKAIYSFLRDRPRYRWRFRL